ncbi:hypothetical protein FB45DRAFT_429012 [Roridomyces roridus]|uniref:Uncharacterized protein n=1 Tax=Roridomyces roridus TaxID=1738132 RepID=A0AAD7C646_9AGAR|nr:hypothetical protein FB45DRAFT_429012 [Roridomyces roridus]
MWCKHLASGSHGTVKPRLFVNVVLLPSLKTSDLASLDTSPCWNPVVVTTLYGWHVSSSAKSSAVHARPQQHRGPRWPRPRLSQGQQEYPPRVSCVFPGRGILASPRPLVRQGFAYSLDRAGVARLKADKKTRMRLAGSLPILRHNDCTGFQFPLQVEDLSFTPHHSHQRPR